MVKEGENVTARYRVTKISADVVELLDLSTDTPRRLALRSTLTSLTLKSDA